MEAHPKEMHNTHETDETDVDRPKLFEPPPEKISLGDGVDPILPVPSRPSRRSHTQQNQQKELASHKGMIIKSGPWLERRWIFRSYTPLAGLGRRSG